MVGARVLPGAGSTCGCLQNQSGMNVFAWNCVCGEMVALVKQVQASGRCDGKRSAE